jgi:hypothetical protein
LVFSLAALAMGAGEARSQELHLDVTQATQDWWQRPERGALSGWAQEDPLARPGVVVEFGKFGLIGENGRLDARMRFGNDAHMRLSATPKRVLLRLKQKF